MLVVLFLVILTIVVPLMIVAPFSKPQVMLVFLIAIGHLSLMFYLHNKLVKETGYAVVVDGNVDAARYDNWTQQFTGYRPFSITRRNISSITHSANFGYLYLIATLKTITDKPILASRILKTLLYLSVKILP